MFCASHRYQMSVYRTIGPLVKVQIALMKFLSNHGFALF